MPVLQHMAIPAFLCSSVPGGSGGALLSHRGAPREYYPASPVEQSTKQHSPFPSEPGALTALWDVLQSWPWALQRFLCCSAHPAGKTHGVPALEPAPSLEV